MKCRSGSLRMSPAQIAPPGLLRHSEHGVQYAGSAGQRLLAQHGLQAIGYCGPTEFEQRMLQPRVHQFGVDRMIGKDPYAGNFHQTRHQETSYAAKEILTILLGYVPTISSAIDVGCGVGTFLSFLEQKGISDVLGLDGNWVDRDLLVIPADKFMPVDLRAFPETGRTYDLSICLEVAEHLPPEKGANFISKLCELSSLILFSAAVPRQGGVAHLNEAWQSYWAKLFAEHDYYPVDIIRPKIWNDSEIPFWYRQNILLYVRKNGAFASQGATVCPLDIIHPELFLMRTEDETNTVTHRGVFKRIINRLRLNRWVQQ